MKEITRVRYRKQENGMLLSSEMMGKEYIVIARIDTKSLVWNITSKEGKLLVDGVGKELSVIKKEVKKSLKGVGVVFLTDLRAGDKLKDGDDLSEEEVS